MFAAHADVRKCRGDPKDAVFAVPEYDERCVFEVEQLVAAIDDDSESDPKITYLIGIRLEQVKT